MAREVEIRLELEMLDFYPNLHSRRHARDGAVTADLRFAVPSPFRPGPPTWEPTGSSVSSPLMEIPVKKQGGKPSYRFEIKIIAFVQT